MKISLNKQQGEAANTLSGPVLVLAGAGAGKTMTLTARIIKIIESGVMPQNILAITFTNKAAGEMRERIVNAIEKNDKFNFPVRESGFTPFVSTFHALGVYIIRENHQKLGISKYFSIYDSADSKKAIKEALKRLDLDPKKWEIKTISSIISKSKGDFIDLEAYRKIASGNYYAETVYTVWKKYEQIKKADKALDFDDLLLETAKLLKNNKDIRDHYLKKWTHIHTDEYQDTNKVQYAILQLLVNEKTQNIFAVGDPDQLIFSWRGADISNIMTFEKDFEDSKLILLEQNYRSTKNIIGASNAVIEKNKERYPKTLFTEQGSGSKISLYPAYSEKQEARYIAEETAKTLKDRKDITGNDIAVLYRANFQSRVLEEAMLREGVSYQVLGTKFFDRAEVKDIVSYIRASQNPESLVDLKRIINSPKRGIGTSSVVKIFAGNTESLPTKAASSYQNFQNILDNIRKESEESSMSDLVKFVIQEAGFEKAFTQKDTDEDKERLANTYELALFAEKYDYLGPEDGILKFLEDVALMGDQDSKKDSNKKPTVKLMTIHASKGLEFDTVFLSGAEEMLFSGMGHGDKKQEEKKTEEERRLFYVAMTRAKKTLHISWSNFRTVYGRTEANFPVSFIMDIPEEYTESAGSFSVHEDDEEVSFLEW